MTWDPELMDDVAAKGIRIQVVAAKLPGQWIVRAIGTFKTVDDLRRQIEPYIALVADRDTIEWTQHCYHIPHYWAYGSGEIKGWGWPEAGVYLFRHVNNDVYGDAERIGS